MEFSVLSTLAVLITIGSALVVVVVYLIRQEGNIKVLSNEVMLLRKEYQSMIAEYRKLNELYMDMRTQVNSNTKSLDELQLLRAAWITATEGK